MFNEAGGGGDDENAGHLFGSALNPASLHHGDDKKELAKPGVKIEAKTCGRSKTGGALIKEEKKEEEVVKKVADKNDIWTEEEINIKAEERPDDRPQPEFEVLFKQHVGTEDVFLGLSDKDPSSTHCDSLLVKVQLPNTSFKNV